MANEQHRRQLADIVASQHLDVVVLGPLVCAGMEAAGTLQDVREFLRLLTDVRRRAGRRVTFILIHHENRAGKVSGAWEGADRHPAARHPDGPRTHPAAHSESPLGIRLPRPNDQSRLDREGGFEVEDKPERTDEAIAEDILTAVAGTPGIGWTKVANAIPGVRDERRRAVRDRLLADGRLANVVSWTGSRCGSTSAPSARPRICSYLTTPPSGICVPTRTQTERRRFGLRPARGDGPAPGSSDRLRPASRPIRDADGGTQTGRPITPPNKIIERTP